MEVVVVVGCRVVFLVEGKELGVSLLYSILVLGLVFIYNLDFFRNRILVVVFCFKLISFR